MSRRRVQKSKPSTDSVIDQPIKVPRPMNCFLLYRQDKQKEILEKCPGANHRDISKIISKWWKEATPQEKEPYVKKAALAKLEHARRYPSYKYMPQKKSKNGTR
ncbi:high mobility group box domain-containing protein, partial [Chlamydoabsidia padenii]